MTDDYYLNALPPGTWLQEYQIERVLGEGSFGIVYLARDKYLHDQVAIKEYLPRDLATRVEGGSVAPTSSGSEANFAWGRQKFLEEARLLKQLASPQPHPNIVAVRRFFEAHGTACLVMDYEKGAPLSEVIRLRGRIPPADLPPLLAALLEGLEAVHEAGITHRDIKPDNILIRPDGTPVFLDFGAARLALGERTQSAFNAMSPAYAALEQHMASDRIGPWTDIYGLGATLYRAVTGALPQTPLERMVEPLHKPASAFSDEGYDPRHLAAIDAALTLKPEERPQSVAEWRALLAPEAPGGDAESTVLLSPSEVAALSAPSPPPPEQQDRGRGQGRGGLWMAGFGIGAAMLAVAGYFLFLAPLSAPQQPMESQRAATVDAEAAADLAAKQEAALAAQRAAEKAAQRRAALEAELAAQRAAQEEEARQQAELAAAQAAEREAARQAGETAREEAERHAKLAAEQEAARQEDALIAERAAEEEARRLAADAARKEAERQAVLAAQRTAEEETARQEAALAAERAAEEEARHQAADAARKEAERKAALAAQRAAEEAAARQEDALAAERAAEEEARRQAAHAARKEAERQTALAAQRAAEEEAARQVTALAAERAGEDEARKQAESEAQAARLAAAEKVRQQAARDELTALTIAPRNEIKVARDAANVRAKPATDGKRLATLTAGQGVRVTGGVVGRDWLRVELTDGSTGYVWGPLLADQTAVKPRMTATELVGYLNSNDAAMKRKLTAYNRQHRVMVPPSGAIGKVQRLFDPDIQEIQGDRFLVAFNAQVSTTLKSGGPWSGREIFELRWKDGELDFVGHQVAALTPTSQSVAAGGEAAVKSQQQVEAFLKDNRWALMDQLTDYNRDHHILVAANGRTKIENIVRQQVARLAGDRVWVESRLSVGRNYQITAGNFLIEYRWIGDQLIIAGHQKL